MTPDEWLLHQFDIGVYPRSVGVEREMFELLPDSAGNWEYHAARWSPKSRTTLSLKRDRAEFKRLLRRG